jgi:hypothetical protein
LSVEKLIVILVLSSKNYEFVCNFLWSSLMFDMKIRFLTPNDSFQIWVEG